MNVHRGVRVLAVVLAVGGLMFSFDSYYNDIQGSSWKAGDPWDLRFNGGIAQDQRDTSLEDHVNAEYVRRDFTFTVSQVGQVANTQRASFVRAAKVHVEFGCTFTAVGTAGFGIQVNPTGLPAGLFGSGTTAMGTFIYFRTAATLTVSGACMWDGVTVSFWSGGQAAGNLGFTPNFAIAVDDGMVCNFSYLPAPNA